MLDSMVKMLTVIWLYVQIVDKVRSWGDNNSKDDRE